MAIEIKAADVMKLRKMTGAGMMDYGNVCVVTILWYSAIWTVYHKMSGVITNEKMDERV